MSSLEKSDIFNVVAFVFIAGATTLVVFLTFQVLLMSTHVSIQSLFFFLVRDEKGIEEGNSLQQHAKFLLD